MVHLNLILEDLKTWGEGIGETIRKNLIPSWVSFVVQAVAFIVPLIVVIVFAYKPVKRMLKKSLLLSLIK